MTEHAVHNVELTEPEVVLVVSALRAMAAILTREPGTLPEARTKAFERAAEASELASRINFDTSFAGIMEKAIDRVDARRRKV